MIHNKSAGTEIIVDYDIFFTDFENVGISYTNKLLSEIESILGIKINAEYRPSCSGNTHVKLSFFSPITVLEGFEIRMFMGDCQDRLRLDMIRYFRTQDLYEINKAFDKKYQFDENCALVNKQAGEWKPLPRDIISDKKCGEIWQDLERMKKETATKKNHLKNQKQLIQCPKCGSMMFHNTEVCKICGWGEVQIK